MRIAGAINVQFGIGSSSSTPSINTPIGRVTFDAVTLFLLCLRDMDRLGIYFDSHPMHGKSPGRQKFGLTADITRALKGLIDTE
jgi:hypothetical protein